jgi:hypothetical protein
MAQGHASRVFDARNPVARAASTVPLQYHNQGTSAHAALGRGLSVRVTRIALGYCTLLQIVTDGHGYVALSACMVQGPPWLRAAVCWQGRG